MEVTRREDEQWKEEGLALVEVLRKTEHALLDCLAMLRGPQGDQVDVPPVPDVDLPLQGQAGGQLPQLQPQGLPQSQQPQHLHLGGGKTLKRVLTSETILRKRIFYFIKPVMPEALYALHLELRLVVFPFPVFLGLHFTFLTKTSSS